MEQKTKIIQECTKGHYVKPFQIERYNKLMGSVDLCDQLLQPYDPSCKSHAWFKKLGIHFFLRMFINAKVMFDIRNGQKTECLTFLMCAYEEILLKYSFPYNVLNIT